MSIFNKNLNEQELRYFSNLSHNKKLDNNNKKNYQKTSTETVTYT